MIGSLACFDRALTIEHGPPIKDRVLLRFKGKSSTPPRFALEFAQSLVLRGAVEHILARERQLFRARNP